MSRSADIVLVTSAGCHFCQEAARMLEELSDVTPLTTRVVSLGSDEGRALAVRYRVPYPPILLVNGDFFGYGRISRRKLERFLSERNALVGPD